MPKRKRFAVSKEALLMGIIFVAAFVFLSFQGSKAGAIGVGIHGSPFSIWNGVERGSSAQFNVTLQNTGNTPANFSIASITGNGSGVASFSSELFASIGNQQRALQPGNSTVWVSSPISITAIPSGTYSLAFNISGKGQVESSSQTINYQFTVSQVKIVILSDVTWGEYIGAGNCQQTVQHGRILNLQVRTPTTVHFTVTGNEGYPCDHNLENHNHCIAKCTDSSCATRTGTVCSPLTPQSSTPTSTIDAYLSTSGYYLVWRASNTGYGQMTGYTWSND